MKQATVNVQETYYNKVLTLDETTD